MINNKSIFDIKIIPSYHKQVKKLEQISSNLNHNKTEARNLRDSFISIINKIKGEM